MTVKEIKAYIAKHKKKELKRLSKFAKFIQDDYPKTKRILIQNGFKKIRYKPAYKHSQHKIVVKKQYLIGGAPNLAVPTLVVNELAIQPLLKTNCHTATKIFEQFKHLRAYNVGYDLHDRNVGLWNGVPVVHDW